MFIEICQQNIHLNGFWRIARLVRQAASDATGALLRFQALVADPKNGRILPGTAPDSAADHLLDTTVEAIRLDDLVQGPVDFIKIDIEGAEERVSAGMQQLLHRSPNVTGLMEFNAQRCTRAAETLMEMEALFPLRELCLNGAVAKPSRAAVLSRTEDTLLLLSRSAL